MAATATAPTTDRLTTGSTTPAQAGVPVTVSGAEMSRLTGVDRERLRTWERRHGFPEPVRSRNDVRRYKVEDVRHVAAISQLAAAGVPLREAIDSVLAKTDEPTAITTLGALDHAPTPAIAVSGPTPLTVAWVNGTMACHAGAPLVGDDLAVALPSLDQAARESIRRILGSTSTEPTVITHTDWTGAFPVPRRSIAWRLETADGSPIALLLQLPEAAVAPPVVSPTALAVQQQSSTWSTALASARRALQLDHGLASVQRSVGALATGAGASDGFLVLGRGEQLRVASSVRGTVTSRIVDRSACSDLVRSVIDGEVDWLGAASKRALGINPNASAVVVPLVASGERLGVTVLLFRAELALGDAARDLLLTYGAMAAATLLRERDAAPVAAPLRAAA
ncbi:MAG: MerR family transcriptional regulator [Solirubrobacteraceae bacterium]|nr:MerR family transcriptional regulator [Patulibacter sp.]